MQYLRRRVFRRTYNNEGNLHKKYCNNQAIRLMREKTTHSFCNPYCFGGDTRNSISASTLLVLWLIFWSILPDIQYFTPAIKSHAVDTHRYRSRNGIKWNGRLRDCQNNLQWCNHGQYTESATVLICERELISLLQEIVEVGCIELTKTFQQAPDEQIWIRIFKLHWVIKTYMDRKRDWHL